MEDTTHSQFSRHTTPIYKLDTRQAYWTPLPGCDLLSTIFDGENNTVDVERLNVITQQLLMVCRGCMNEAMIRGFHAILTDKSIAFDSFVPLSYVFLGLLVIPEVRQKVPNISKAHMKFLENDLVKYFNAFHMGTDSVATSSLTPQNVDKWVRVVIARLNMRSTRVHASTR